MSEIYDTIEKNIVNTLQVAQLSKDKKQAKSEYKAFWDESVETLPRAELDKLQENLLVAVIVRYNKDCNLLITVYSLKQLILQNS